MSCGGNGVLGIFTSSSAEIWLWLKSTHQIPMNNHSSLVFFCIHLSNAIWFIASFDLSPAGSIIIEPPRSHLLQFNRFYQCFRGELSNIFIPCFRDTTSLITIICIYCSMLLYGINHCRYCIYFIPYLLNINMNYCK